MSQSIPARLARSGGSWPRRDVLSIGILLAVGSAFPAMSQEYPAHDRHPSQQPYVGLSRQAPVIESVRIEGNHRTRARLIHRLLGVTPEKELDEASLEEGRRRLLGLGVFRSVSLRLERGEEEGRVVLIVSVVERGSIVISDLFLGFTNVTPFFAGFGLSDTNVLGTALFAQGAFVIGGEERQAYRFTVFDPTFREGSFSAGLGVSYVRGLELSCPLGFAACGADGFHRLAYRRGGATVFSGAPVGNLSRVLVKARLEAVHSERRGLEEARDHDDESQIHGLPFLFEGQSRVSTLAVAFEHDSTDDPFLARRGTRAHLLVEVGSKLFGSSYEYSRYGLELEMHRPALRSHSFTVGVFGGFVQGAAPFFDRFHVADHSYFTVGARAVPRALGLSFTEISQYDDVLFSSEVSYRVPIQMSSTFVYRAYMHLSAALTLSAHTVESSLLDLSLDPRNELSRFPVSGDIGLRLDTAVGAFSLGLSYPLDLLL